MRQDKNNKDTKPASSTRAQDEASQSVVLPKALSMKGQLHTHLAAMSATFQGDGKLQSAVSALMAALLEFRTQCRERLRSAPPEPEMRERVCASLLRERRGNESGIKSFLRLLVVVMLTDDADEALLRQGVESYTENPELFQQTLGPVMPARLKHFVSSRCYLENAHHAGESDWKVFRERMQVQREKILPGLATGLAPFDELTGGLYDLMVLAGDTTSGKTTLAQQLAIGALERDPDVGVLFVDLELGKDSLHSRLLSREAQLAPRRLFAKDQTELERHQVEEADRRIIQNILPRHFIQALDPQQPHSITFQWFVELIKKWRDRWQTDKIVLVVDSLQKLPVGAENLHGTDDDGPISRPKPPEGELARMRIELLLQVQRWSKRVSPPTGFPMLVTSRTRKATASGRLEIADVLGSVGTVFDASAVLLLEPSGKPSAEGITSSILNIAKVRDFGMCGDIHLDFHFTHSTFCEVGPSAPKTVSPPKDKPARFGGKS